MKDLHQRVSAGVKVPTPVRCEVLHVLEDIVATDEGAVEGRRATAGVGQVALPMYDEFFMVH